MDVSTQIGRDHPVDLKRVVRHSDGTLLHEHLLTFLPVQFRGGSAKFCFVGRSDVHIIREGARNGQPPATSTRPARQFTNLAMTLRGGDRIKVGTGLIELQLLAVDRSRATIRISILSENLLLNLEPLAGTQELNLRGMIERLNQGADYRSDALEA